MVLLHLSVLIYILFCLDVEVMMLFIPFKSQYDCLFSPLCFAHSALSEEEKTTLRAALITNFNEPVNQVSCFNVLFVIRKK